MITIDAHQHFWDPGRGDYDWSVCDYRTWINIARDLLAGVSADSRDDIMGGNAIMWYGLDVG